MSDEINLNIGSIQRIIKVFLKNTPVLVFSLMALLSFIFSVFGHFQVSLKIGFLTEITQLFSPAIWVVLGLVLAVSAILAYHEKYNLMFIPILVWILLMTSVVRTANIPDLRDVTTGGYTLGPDLDPFLYLRVAQEIIDFGSPLNPDYMRYHGIKPYYNFIPYGIAYLYKFLSLFTDSSLEYAAIIFPVIFFCASIIVFFLFVRKIFNRRSVLQKNLIAIFSAALYAATPLMLHRTVAGVPELESAGLFFFWLSFLFFLYAWEEKGENNSKVLSKRNLFALLSGISTSLMIFTWGGSKFILMSLPIAVLIEFILGKIKKEEITIYSLWFLPSIFFLVLKSGFFSIIELTNGLPPTFVFAVLIAGTLINKDLEEKIKGVLKTDWISKEMVSVFFVVLLGLLALLIADPGYLFGLIGSMKESLLYPFGRQRVGLTVAENAQPYVTDWLSQFGKGFFWLFFFGTIFLFHSTIEHLAKKEKIILDLSFILFIFGFIFSRYSSSSVFNGQNFISQLVYFGSLILFAFFSLSVYIKRYKKGNLNELLEIDFSHVFILSLIILMIIASRGAVRLFVISSPVFIIAAGFLPVALLSYWKRSKDDIFRLVLLVLLLISLSYLIMTFMTYERTTSENAKFSVPSYYNIQWQQAMSWVRENTARDSMFVHWWDYGYWVQTLGKRPTVTDGGHDNTYWDHLIGRYVLTTTQPESALSFMKTHNVSYLLIDSSDLGKYTAYSSIGSDAVGEDRFAQIPIMLVDPSQTIESSGKEARIYRGGAPVDEDIVYSEGNSSVFLPSGRAFVIGMVVELSKSNDSLSFSQPAAVFVYNDQQVRIPVRYLYYKGQIIDFGSGIESVARMMQGVTASGQQGISIDNIHAVIYLSPKVSKGLFAQLYLMDDPLKKYTTLTLAHSEQDLFVSGLKAQGVGLDDIVYFQGFRGPIKIWKTEYPENIAVNGEFLKTSGGFGELDSLRFVR
ncbi:MAG: STT3 domain-containing protein [Nanoarchaeota archaeon]